MKCPKCHADNPDTSRFCSNCATSLTSAKAAPPSLTETLESPVRTITPGTVFAGRYEILGQIGAGGMGEVYRAIDKNLGRHVAIKVLPSAFAEDKERMARFEREAKLLAVLNHTNIAAIHGLEKSEGRRFLILELVEGETLQARLNRGPLPVEEALETCRELAEGLEAAHEKGIIHRDLKPGNIMITPEGKVKILDFGLAKAYGGETTGVVIENSPTITAQMTEPGVILGTAAYMSPEQARGRAVDRRSDVWAFGCVLYECLTGSRAFHGETVSDTLAHILKGEPDWNKLPTETPTLIKVLLRRCLEKDPRKRLHDIADARLEIEAPAAYPSEPAMVPRRLPLLWMAGAAGIMLLAGFLIDRLVSGRHQPAPTPQLVTSTINVEPGHWLEGMRVTEERPTRTAMTISGDGRFVVYSAIEENPGPQALSRLYLRRMDQSEAKPITGTEGGINPFLSPDNRWVGFWADKKLKKVPVEGGVPHILWELSEWFYGADWGSDNNIVFADSYDSGISMVSAEGGKPEILTKPDPKREEYCHRLPSWLPNGKAVLFTVMRHAWDRQPWLALLRLDTHEWHVLLEDAADARYVPTGHLVFLRQATLMAVRFDLARMEVVGQPIALLENVMQAFGEGSYFHTGAGQLGVSDMGSLIYVAGGILPDIRSSLMWVDQRGIEQPITDKQFRCWSPRLSPDGQKIAYTGREDLIYVYDLGRDTNSRLTGEGFATNAIWTPDGKRLLFSWMKSLMSNLYWQSYDGSSPMERLTSNLYFQLPTSWSSDGKTVALVEVHPDTNYDITMLDTPSGRVTPFLNSQFTEIFPDFSPDGRWIAYTSDESKREEVYVRAFPGPGMKQQVSGEGGDEPLWARNGKQLFYRWQDQVWVVDVRTEGGFSASRPRLLIEKPGYASNYPIRGYDLSLDSQRFLMAKLEQRKPTPVTEMILIQNWFEELKRLAPTGKK
jgi:serine/threonine-protein kinase